MATSPADTKAADAKPVPDKAKGGGGKAVLTIVAAAIGAAAGGFGAVIAAGALGIGGGGGHAASAPAVEASPVEYFEIDQAFTSNLADTGRYLQVRLSVSHNGGEAMAAAIVRHKPAIVSAVLGVLGEAGEADVATRPAKDRLRLRLKQVINETLKSNGVAGGIDSVFFTSLVVQ